MFDAEDELFVQCAVESLNQVSSLTLFGASVYRLAGILVKLPTYIGM